MKSDFMGLGLLCFTVDLNHLAHFPGPERDEAGKSGEETLTEAAKEASFSRRWKLTGLNLSFCIQA